jgi:hypothetical protein
MLGQVIDHPCRETGRIGKRDAGFGDKRIQGHFSSRACPMLACKRFDFADIARHSGWIQVLLAHRLQCKGGTSLILLNALPITN